MFPFALLLGVNPFLIYVYTLFFFIFILPCSPCNALSGAFDFYILLHSDYQIRLIKL